MSTLSVRVVNASLDNKQRQHWFLKISFRGRDYAIRKRFKEFVSLNNHLNATLLKDLTLLHPFPERNMPWSSSKRHEDVLKRRQMQLQAWIDALISMNVVNSLLREFFGVDEFNLMSLKREMEKSGGLSIRLQNIVDSSKLLMLPLAIGKSSNTVVSPVANSFSQQSYFSRRKSSFSAFFGSHNSASARKVSNTTTPPASLSSSPSLFRPASETPSSQEAIKAEDLFQRRASTSKFIRIVASSSGKPPNDDAHSFSSFSSRGPSPSTSFASSSLVTGSYMSDLTMMGPADLHSCLLRDNYRSYARHEWRSRGEDILELLEGLERRVLPIPRTNRSEEPVTTRYRGMPITRTPSFEFVDCYDEEGDDTQNGAATSLSYYERGDDILEIFSLPIPALAVDDASVFHGIFSKVTSGEPWPDLIVHMAVSDGYDCGQYTTAKRPHQDVRQSGAGRVAVAIPNIPKRKLQEPISYRRK